MGEQNVHVENEARIGPPARNSQGSGWDTDDEIHSIY
jgi:hypothetical protein